MTIYEILPGKLYLSSYQGALELDPEQKKNFFVINCTKDLNMVPGFKYGTRLYVDDSPNDVETMKNALPLMVKYIEDSNDKVLVHCFAGQQRSAAVVAAYLMKHMNMSVREAVDFIKSKKPDAFAGGVHFFSALSPTGDWNWRIPGQEWYRIPDE